MMIDLDTLAAIVQGLQLGHQVMIVSPDIAVQRVAYAGDGRLYYRSPSLVGLRSVQLNLAIVDSRCNKEVFDTIKDRLVVKRGKLVILPVEETVAERMRTHMDNANRIIQKWPDWKRNLLQQTTKSTSNRPRG